MVSATSQRFSGVMEFVHHVVDGRAADDAGTRPQPRQSLGDQIASAVTAMTEPCSCTPPAWPLRTLPDLGLGSDGPISSL